MYYTNIQVFLTQKVLKEIMFKKFLCLKTKQNTEISDGEHSDSEFYYPEEQETAERKASTVTRSAF